MNHRHRATETFWEDFYRLSPSQKESARRAWEVFKQDPFDARLRTHKIHRLSSIMKRTVHAVVIEGNLTTAALPAYQSQNKLRVTATLRCQPG